MPDQQLDTSAQHKHIWQCDLELQLVNKSYTLTHAVTNQSRTSATYRPCGLRYERKKESREKSYIYIHTHTHCLRLVKLKENMRVWTIRSSITIPFEVNCLSRFRKKKKNLHLCIPDNLPHKLTAVNMKGTRKKKVSDNTVAGHFN